MAQSVKCPTLAFGSGRDLTVLELELRIRLRTDSAEPAWDSLSLPRSLPLLLVTLSVSQNKSIVFKIAIQ